MINLFDYFILTDLLKKLHSCVTQCHRAHQCQPLGCKLWTSVLYQIYGHLVIIIGFC